MKTKYFVVSLPRTGTSTICGMAKILNIKWSHAPQKKVNNMIINSDIELFSDTPIYNFNFIKEILFIDNIEPKFIYIERDFDEIFKSWVKSGLYRNYKNMYQNPSNLTESQRYDIQTYNETFDNIFLNEENYGDLFKKHQEKVLDLITVSNKDLLIYNFKDGWKPFCDFLNKDIPQDNIPHLNKNKMFDKI